MPLNKLKPTVPEKLLDVIIINAHTFIIKLQLEKFYNNLE